MTKGLIEFHSNGDAFARRLNLKIKEVEIAGRRGLNDIIEDWATKQRAHFREDFNLASLGTPKARIRTRRGKLRSSVRGSVYGKELKNMRARLRVGSKWAPYAAAQEWGSNPTARPGRYMRIPLRQALTPTGKLKAKAKPRRDGISIHGNQKWTSDYGRLEVIRTKAGNLVIVAKRRGRKKGSWVYATKEPLFILKESVRVPPRLDARKNLGIVLKKRMPRIRKDIVQILSPSSYKGGGR